MPSGARCVGPSVTCLQAQSRSALLFCGQRHGSHPIFLLSRRVFPVGVPDVIWGRRYMNRPKSPCVLPRFVCFTLGRYVLSLSSAFARGTTACVACAEEARRSANKLQTPKWHRPQHAFSGKTIIKIENSCIIRKSCASTIFAQMQSVLNFCWGE